MQLKRARPQGWDKRAPTRVSKRVGRLRTLRTSDPFKVPGASKEARSPPLAPPASLGHGHLVSVTPSPRDSHLPFIQLFQCGWGR